MDEEFDFFTKEFYVDAYPQLNDPKQNYIGPHIKNRVLFVRSCTGKQFEAVYNSFANDERYMIAGCKIFPEKSIDGRQWYGGERLNVPMIYGFIFYRVR